MKNYKLNLNKALLLLGLFKDWLEAQRIDELFINVDGDDIEIAKGENNRYYAHLSKNDNKVIACWGIDNGLVSDEFIIQSETEKEWSFVKVFDSEFRFGYNGKPQTINISVDDDLTEFKVSVLDNDGVFYYNNAFDAFNKVASLRSGEKLYFEVYKYELYILAPDKIHMVTHNQKNVEKTFYEYCHKSFINPSDCQWMNYLQNDKELNHFKA